jgi:hypothetical protein
METIFQLSNLLVMPFWLLMIFLPHWRWTRRIIASPWIVAPAAALYAVLVLPSLPTLLPVLANPQLGAIALALGKPPTRPHGVGRHAAAFPGSDGRPAGPIALPDRTCLDRTWGNAGCPTGGVEAQTYSLTTCVACSNCCVQGEPTDDYRPFCHD